jgi:hypothetical protein
MFERQKLTASIADLDTSLTDVHRDDFTHFQRELKLGVQKAKNQHCGRRAARRMKLTETEWGERTLG